MRIRLILLCLLLAWTLPLTAAATELDLSAPEPTATPRPAPALSGAPLLDAPPMTLNCAAALLLEPQSGQILFELNADAPRAVASVTKLMTILLTLEAVDDGRISLTEALYGSEQLCAARMNARAEQLGMEHTHYVNCTGLPAEGQRTTARDVARLSAAVFSHENYYDFSKIWLDEVDHGDGRVTDLTNTNRLIRFYDGCDGGKTGSTNEAGYCIAATARRGGMRLIAVVLGGSSGKKRFACAEKMFDHGFANYRLLTAAERGTRVRGEMPVTGGSLDSVPLALDGDLTLLMNKAEAAEIELKPNLPPSVAAPVAAGDEIGSVDILLNGRTIARIPVAAAGSVARQGFPDAWRRLWEGWMF